MIRGFHRCNREECEFFHDHFLPKEGLPELRALSSSQHLFLSGLSAGWDQNLTGGLVRNNKLIYDVMIIEGLWESCNKVIYDIRIIEGL